MERLKKDLNIPLFNMVMCLSDAMDLISPIVTGHHKRVAYIASSLALEMGLSKRVQKELIIAGALHDIGAFSLKESLNSSTLEDSRDMWKNIEDIELSLSRNSVNDVIGHAEAGYWLLKDFKPFAEIASIIRYHHIDWYDGQGSEVNGREVSLASHILHLADRIDVYLDRNKEILAQAEEIKEKVSDNCNNKFVPEVVDAFIGLSDKEAFWFNIDSGVLERVLARRIDGINLHLDNNKLIDLTRVFSQIIDFRSEFTATHSSGVAATAYNLSRLVGLSDERCDLMKVAGYLHDIGKLAVPLGILNKKAKLNKSEFNIIKRHPFYTYQILDRVEELEDIKMWAALHHERIDGKGYPFGYKGDQLSLESKIMAVADVFTALTEDRPYRQGMNIDKALKIVKEMGADLALSKEVIVVLERNSKKIDEFRYVAQYEKSSEYKSFWEEVG